MGWNVLETRVPAPHLAGLPDTPYVYFVHSYYVIPEDPAIVATETAYGVRFASSIVRGNIFACQWHPEKSQAVGLQVLSNFGALATAA
jgi:glutamine amidotransferase